jgi:hypothetical protein
MTTACTEQQSEVVLEPTDLAELASGESHTYEVTTKLFLVTMEVSVPMGSARRLQMPFSPTT